MGLLFGKKDEFLSSWDYDAWTKSPRGKKFMKQCKAAARKTREREEEYQRNAIPERVVQVKWFKIFFTIFFLGYVAALMVGLKKGIALKVLLVETLVSLASLALFKIKPSKVKYPNCFLMPVIALGCTVLFGAFIKADNYFTNSAVQAAVGAKETAPSGDDLKYSEYSKFLKENNIETEEELEKDYENYRRKYGDE